MKETAPLWSMRGRISNNKIDSFPGPGAYSPTNSVMFQPPNYRVGTAPRKSLAELSLTPGPGTYTPSKSIEAPCWTILGRTNKSSLGRSVDTPGPGTYRITQSQGSPRYSVGKAQRGSIDGKNSSPGPGSYNPQSVPFKGNSLFGKSERTGCEYKTQNPGPGVYEPKSFIVEGPRFSFRPKLKQKEAFQVPGPGNYEPNHEAVKEKAPVWGTKSSIRAGLTSSSRMTPGPGTYVKNSTLSGPKWGFGSEKRGKHSLSLSPGPGTYEIRSTIGSTPTYVQVSKPQ